MSERREDLLPGVPRIESPFFESIFARDEFDAETRRVARELNERGYAIVDFPDPDFARVADEIRARLEPKFGWQDWRDFGHAKGMGLRLQDQWREEPAVRRLATNATILELLARLYGRRAFPFQTLSFPVGTQQQFHSDSVHFSSIPERFMCGVWVALEDVTEDAGPLVYYPGSHRWPIYTNEHVGRCAAEIPHTTTQAEFEPLWEALVEESGLEPARFLAKKGQALIWAANLFHGGLPQTDASLTRWSQVTHYFFEDCVYYTPMLSDPIYGSVDFRHPIDVATELPVPPTYAGHPIPDEALAALKVQRIELPEGFDRALYLEANPDVARAGMDPEEHWRQYGMREGRALVPED